MKFKVSKIAAAVAVGLGTSMVGMNVAQADSVFFPYLIASPSVTSILSVVDEGSAVANTMHYRYYYKRDAGSAQANRVTGCTEADYENWTSPNDVVTFDISNHFGAANGVLFETPVATARYSDFAIFRNRTVRANAVVDNNAQFAFGRNVNGEAFIITFDTGSVWGYPAYNAAEILTFTPPSTIAVANEYDFSDRAEVNGEVLTQPVPANLAQAAALERYRVPITIMPFAEVTTRLFVTPVNPNPPFQVPVERNVYSANIRLEVNDNTSLQQVMFDRDEQPVSGRVTQPIVCVGAVDVPELVNEAIRSRVASGGWAYVGILQGNLATVSVITDTGTANVPAVNVNQAITLKLEYNDKAPAKLNGQDAGGGSYNNGFWLRKGIRESVPRNFVLATYPVLPVFQMPDAAQDVNSPYMVISTAGVDAYNATTTDPNLKLPVADGYVPLAFNPAQNVAGNTAADYVLANSKVPGVIAPYDVVKSALQK
jgi:hypothetical protein